MTDPVILLGTQSNGETLPVQVDAFGRLVAEGLQGPEGPEGPEGPQGPEGPPGPGGIELPPDPYEGALLGWLNNELSWVGTPPIPIPSNVFGPITAWDPQSGLLTVDGKIPDTVGNGVYLYQCDERGNNYTEGWNITKVWSDPGNFTTSTSFYPQFPTTMIFDGDNQTVCYVTGQGSTITWDCSLFNLKGAVRVRPTNDPSNRYVVRVNDIQVSTSDEPWSNSQTFEDVQTISVSGMPGQTDGGLLAVEIEGLRLVDSSSSLNYRVNQVFSETQLVGVPSATVDFTIGKYLRVPEQRIAPWVLYGHDPTSLIDHLRSK